MQGYTHIANILPLNDVNTIINVLNTPRTPKTDCLGNKKFFCDVIQMLRNLSVQYIQTCSLYIS